MTPSSGPRAAPPQGFDKFDPLTFVEHALPVAFGIGLCAAAHEAVRAGGGSSSSHLHRARPRPAPSRSHALTPSLPRASAQGHRIVAAQKKVDLGPSFFIPNGDVGTFGAVTQIKSLLQGREDLFDIAVAGPLAGGAVALGLFGFGLAASAGGGGVEAGLLPVPGALFNGSLLLGGISSAVLGSGKQVLVHPALVAGWCGLVTSAFNLLPVRAACRPRSPPPGLAPRPAQPHSCSALLRGGEAGKRTGPIPRSEAVPHLPRTLRPPAPLPAFRPQMGRTDGGRMAMAAYGRRSLSLTSLLSYLGLAIGILGGELALNWGLYVLIVQRDPEPAPLDDVTAVDEKRSTLAGGLIVRARALPAAPGLPARRAACGRGA